MDKRDRTVLELLSSQINFYNEILLQINYLHALAVEDEDELAVATKKASEGLSELVGHFSLQQDAIMKRNGAVHVPIKYDKEHYEIHFKGIHPKSSPLW